MKVIIVNKILFEKKVFSSLEEFKRYIETIDLKEKSKEIVVFGNVIGEKEIKKYLLFFKTESVLVISNKKEYREIFQFYSVNTLDKDRYILLEGFFNSVDLDTVEKIDQNDIFISLKNKINPVIMKKEKITFNSIIEMGFKLLIFKKRPILVDPVEAFIYQDKQFLIYDNPKLDEGLSIMEIV